MKGLFQCPPWARSFCPFRACCFWSFWAFSPFLNHMRKFSLYTKQDSFCQKRQIAPAFVCNILCKDIKNFIINRDLSVFFYIFAE